FVIPYRGGKGELYENRAYYLIDNVRLTSASYPPIEHVDTLQTETLYTFKNVQFEFNSAELIPNTLTEIDQLASYLLSNSYHIIITGHTDETGEVKYNQVLSENRAKSVAQYLISLGISANRIQTEGKGESRPLITEGNKKEMDAKNRRVEFVVRN
ncbi:MAG: OmpA family protein, partial [Cyclobacteriaceae bacterium]|nr:OmpA family protein [Cyclobacteriaceae bacterium]